MDATLIAELAGIAAIVLPSLTIVFKLMTLVTKLTTLTDAHEVLVRRVEDIATMITTHVQTHPDHTSTVVTIPPSHSINLTPTEPPE